MRFFADGPNIPDVLLHKRDEGNVVFVCGAGVSRNAGLPLFDGLAKEVAKKLIVPSTSEVKKALRAYRKNGPKQRVPLDQVFLQMQDEYGVEEVNRYITEILERDRCRSRALKEHQLIVRLSANQLGDPQIVTTNFDQLFEQAVHEVTQKEYPVHVAPMVPNIAAKVPITGITYLHGRLQPDDKKSRFYITSSADFGLAYLAEGWATSFVRSLLERYTVVFVGYQAEDPPVKYLLQGLKRQQGGNEDRLYAFDQGPEEEVRTKWLGRGVTAIEYGGEENHEVLWDTLEAWAERASDPDAWRNHVITTAKKGPRGCKPFERGQVAHLVRTEADAKVFSTKDAPPEWICVFDYHYRSAEPYHVYGVGRELYAGVRINPLEEYRLDTDPPYRYDENGKRIGTYEDFLGRLRGEGNPDQSHRISRWEPVGAESTPRRLEYLMDWFTKHLEAPITAWWAIRQPKLHPVLTRKIRLRVMQEEELCPKVKKLWGIILEYHEDGRRGYWLDGLVDIQQRADHEGWHPGIIRAFDDRSAPCFKQRRTGVPIDPRSLPSTWEGIDFGDVLDFEVAFPVGLDRRLEVPDDVLCRVFSILEGNLLRAAGMLQDLGVKHFRTQTCYQEDEVDDRKLPHSSDRAFLLFVKLFDRMIARFPLEAIAGAYLWSLREPYFFCKLKLYALAKREFMSADSAVTELLGMPEAAFWNPYVERELLFLLRSRWSEFSDEQKHKMIERLLVGPEYIPGNTDRERERRRNERAAQYVKWLVKEGCDLSDDQYRKLEGMIDGISGWREEHVSEVSSDRSTQAGWVGENKTPNELLDLPESEIVKKALAMYKLDTSVWQEIVPFAGLVEVRPDKALNALMHHVKHEKQYPPLLWQQLIRNWPKDTDDGLLRKFLEALCGLPGEQVRHLHGFLGEWLRERFAYVHAMDETLAWKVFDHVAPGKPSGRSKKEVESVRDDASTESNGRETHNYALNHPMGAMTAGLMSVLESKRIERGTGLPKEFAVRFEKLSSPPRKESNQVVAILTQKLGYLYLIDPKWTERVVLPWFDIDHPLAQAAWSGFQYCSMALPIELGKALEKDLMSLFPTVHERGWEQSVIKAVVGRIIALMNFIPRRATGLKVSDVRDCLRNMDSSARDYAIFQLKAEAIKRVDGWRTFFIPFVEEIWPKEIRYRSADNTFAWVQVLGHSGTCFPEAVKAVKHLLIRTSHRRDLFWMYRNGREGQKELVIEYPEAVLEMLHATIANSAKDAPDSLEYLVQSIGEICPSLKGDEQWIRLARLVEK